jgi:hypothetical protein
MELAESYIEELEVHKIHDFRLCVLITKVWMCFTGGDVSRHSVGLKEGTKVIELLKKHKEESAGIKLKLASFLTKYICEISNHVLLFIPI